MLRTSPKHDASECSRCGAHLYPAATALSPALKGRHVLSPEIAPIKHDYNISYSSETYCCTFSCPAEIRAITTTATSRCEAQKGHLNRAACLPGALGIGHRRRGPETKNIPKFESATRKRERYTGRVHTPQSVHGVVNTLCVTPSVAG